VVGDGVAAGRAHDRLKPVLARRRGGRGEARAQRVEPPERQGGGGAVEADDRAERVPVRAFDERV
jgi:hypothetical protein